MPMAQGLMSTVLIQALPMDMEFMLVMLMVLIDGHSMPQMQQHLHTSLAISVLEQQHPKLYLIPQVVQCEFKVPLAMELYQRLAKAWSLAMIPLQIMA